MCIVIHQHLSDRCNIVFVLAVEMSRVFRKRSSLTVYIVIWWTVILKKLKCRWRTARR